MSIRNSEVARFKSKSQQPKQTNNLIGNQPLVPAPRSKKERIYGAVIEIKANKVYLELNETLNRLTARTHIDAADEEYFIRFMSDRTTATLEHRALEYVNNQNIAHYFFPNIITANNWPINKTHPSSYSDQP